MSSRPPSPPQPPARSVPRLPSRFLIDFANRCNLRCPMCVVWGSEDSAAIRQVSGAMSEEHARRILDEIMAAKPLVQPTLWSEPLMIPQIGERIRDMKARGITVALNTNGLRLTEALAEAFVQIPLDSIFFSIDATTRPTRLKVRGTEKLEKVEAAVHRMLQTRGDREHPRVGVSFTEQEANRHEREAFVERWIGVVDCVRVDLLFEDGTFQVKADPGPRQPCPALYETMAIHHNGHVSVCCLDGWRETNMGNVFTDGGVEAVWNGEALRQARHYHETGQWDKVPFCKSCNGWARYQAQEEVRDGILIRRSPQHVYYNRIDRMRNWKGALLGTHRTASRPQDTAAENRPALR